MQLSINRIHYFYTLRNIFAKPKDTLSNVYLFFADRISIYIYYRNLNQLLAYSVSCEINIVFQRQILRKTWITATQGNFESLGVTFNHVLIFNLFVTPMLHFVGKVLDWDF